MSALRQAYRKRPMEMDAGRQPRAGVLERPTDDLGAEVRATRVDVASAVRIRETGEVADRPSNLGVVADEHDVNAKGHRQRILTQAALPLPGRPPRPRR